MARAPKAGIDVTVDERPAVAGLKRLSKEFAATAVTINQSMEIAGKVFGAVQAGVSAVVSTMADAVRAAMEVERVERRAFAAMQSRAGMTREEFDALSQLNDARERRLNIDADEQLQLQGTLAALGVHKDALNAATEATIGLSAVTGQGLAEAGKKVTQVLNGNTNALKELGIQASSVADAQDQLRAMFALAEAQGDTLETRLAGVGHAFGSLQEEVGKLVTDSDELKKGLDAVTSALVEITTHLQSAQGKQAAREFFGVMLELAADTMDSMLGLFKLVQEIRGKGDRESLLSRAGGALSFISAANPALLLYKSAVGEGAEHAQVLREALDQALGRGVSGTDAPILQTLEQLSNRLRQAAREAQQVQEPPLAELVRDEPRLRPSSTAAGKDKPGEPASRTIDIGEMFSDTAAEIAAAEVHAENQRIQAAREIIAQSEQEYQQQLGDIKREAMQAEWEKTIALGQELHRRGIDVDLAQGQERLQAQLDQSNTIRQMAQQGAEMVASGLSSMIANMVNGSMSAEEAFKGFIGSLITNLGTMLLNVGTAAVVLGGLSLIPGLQFLAGPPGVGIGAGFAAIGAGAGLIAVGAAIGGGSGASARAPAPGRGAGGGSMPRAPSSSMGDMVPRGFGGLAMPGVAPYTVNISFSGVVGDERRAARMIEDVLRRGR